MKDTFVEWVMERRERSSFSEPKEKREETYKRYEESIKKKIELLNEGVKKIKKQLAEEKGEDTLTTAFITLETNIAKNLLAELNEVTVYSRLKGIFGDKNRFEFKRG